MPCNAGYDWCKNERVICADGGNEYCLFHAPSNKKGMDDTKFNVLVLQHISERISRKFNELDLSGIVIPDKIDFNRYQKHHSFPRVIFRKAYFGGPVIFDGTHFNGEADFSGAKFESIISIFKADFKKGLILDLAECKGNFTVSETTIDEIADFRDVHFYEDVIIAHTDFGVKSNFTAAVFDKEAVFFMSKFQGKATFRSTTFKKDASFHDIEAERIVFEGMDLRNISFDGTDLRKFNFINCTWLKDHGHKILYDEKKIISENDSYKLSRVELLYRRLKQKYKDELDETEVSDWHYCEKEMQRKGTKYSNLFYWIFLDLYRISSGYGEKPNRAGFVLITLLLLAILCMGLNGIVNVSGSNNDLEDQQEIISFYDSKYVYQLTWADAANIALTTAEHLTFQKNFEYKPYGDSGRFIKLIFQFLIFVQFTLFAFALRNRFRR